MAARHVPMSEAQAKLPEIAGNILRERTTVVIDVAYTPGVALVPAEVLEGYEETIELMSDALVLQRIRESEWSLQSGAYITQGDFERELKVVPPASRPTQQWRLVVSTSARQSIVELAPHIRDAVVRFLIGPLLDNPRTGIPLAGELGRLFVAVVCDHRVVYRLDSTQKIVRLIDVHRFCHAHFY